MTFFSEDRGAELRALFFEGAEELLQSLNEAGLELEQRPADVEVIRRVRRAVHTLKGDSAACGFHALSELAHELEDVLSPQVGEAHGPGLAEVVLAAADTFDAMLSAYRADKRPPSPKSLRTRIRRLLTSATPDVSPVAETERNLPARFEWTEYEQLMIAEALHRGEAVYNIALRVDPSSPMSGAALQLIRNVLHGVGTVLALRPEDDARKESVEWVEAALSSPHPPEWLERKFRIPSVVVAAHVERALVADTPEHQMLGDLLDSESAVPPEGLTRPAGEAPAKAVPGASAAVTAVAENSLRVETSRIDAVMNLVGELIIGKSMLQRTIVEFDRRFPHDPLRAKLADALAFQSRVLDELQKSVMMIRMVPVDHLFRRFPRIVRDVAKLCGKDVALDVTGHTTDLDKSILDALAEPLTHLVRNAVDHGIEPAEERLAAGKPARGTLYLNAYHQGAQVVLEIRDDGRGIDPHRVLQRALQKGIVSSDEAGHLNEQEVLNLIFEPGFSTAAEVTEVSGRGVGMDVVRSCLERLKGTVHVLTRPGKGTTFELRVPLTLASIQALLFRVGGRLYAVPLSSVLEITRITEDEIHRVDQREVIQLRDQILTLVRLDRLGKIHSVEDRKRSFIIVIGAAEKRFGLMVDSMVGEEELVVKAISSDLVSSELVSGASILGDGTVVLILNVAAVLTRLSRAPVLGAIA